jgi:hypothetical protein
MQPREASRPKSIHYGIKYLIFNILPQRTKPVPLNDSSAIALLSIFLHKKRAKISPFIIP